MEGVSDEDGVLGDELPHRRLGVPQRERHAGQLRLLDAVHLGHHVHDRPARAAKADRPMQEFTQANTDEQQKRQSSWIIKRRMGDTQDRWQS